VNGVVVYLYEGDWISCNDLPTRTEGIKSVTAEQLSYLDNHSTLKETTMQNTQRKYRLENGGRPVSELKNYTFGAWELVAFIDNAGELKFSYGHLNEGANAFSWFNNPSQTWAYPDEVELVEDEWEVKYINGEWCVCFRCGGSTHAKFNSNSAVIDAQREAQALCDRLNGGGV